VFVIIKSSIDVGANFYVCKMVEIHHTKNPIIAFTFILNLLIFLDKVYNNFRNFFIFKKQF
jgi:hypothetical protein